MFESKVSSPEVIACFDELFGRRYPSTTPASAGLLAGLSAEAGGCARAENRAVAGQLAEIGRLFAYRLSRCAETEDWYLGDRHGPEIPV